MVPQPLCAEFLFYKAVCSSHADTQWIRFHVLRCLAVTSVHVLERLIVTILPCGLHILLGNIFLLIDSELAGNFEKNMKMSKMCCIPGTYTLPQKKRRFNPSIFPVDPGSLTLTQGHVSVCLLTLSWLNLCIDLRCQTVCFLLELSVRCQPQKYYRFVFLWTTKYGQKVSAHCKLVDHHNQYMSEVILVTSQDMKNVFTLLYIPYQSESWSLFCQAETSHKTQRVIRRSSSRQKIVNLTTFMPVRAIFQPVWYGQSQNWPDIAYTSAKLWCMTKHQPWLHRESKTELNKTFKWAY